MAKSYIHELGDRLSNGFTADNLPKHIKEIAPIMYNDGSNNFNSIQGALNGKMDKQTAGNISEPVYIENGIAKIATNVATKDELNAKQNSLTAGDNITIDGNTISSDQIFVANYGTTTFAEIKAALNAGKLCVAFRSNRYYYTVFSENTYMVFVSPSGQNTIYSMTLLNSDKWLNSVITFQSKLTFDTSPTAGSTNPVTSNGIKSAIDTVNAKGLTVKEISGEQVICFE